MLNFDKVSAHLILAATVAQVAVGALLAWAVGFVHVIH
jgi:hypothetical protein